jgi:zinc transport system permease protein
MGGLFGSLQYDTPSGPSIVVAALLLFVLSIVIPVQRMRRRRLEAANGP